MSEVLSQSEIDALLSALSTGEMSAEELKEEGTTRRIKTYDFKRALRFSKDQIRSLTRIHENFARLLTSYFSAQLRTYVQIQVASVDQLPYDEFIRSIPKMTLLNIFRIEPLEGQIVLEVNPSIAFAMLERMLGGEGRGQNDIDNLTEIETVILEKIFSQTLGAFEEAWKGVIDLKARMNVLELNPQFMQIVSPNETVILITFSTKIGETTGMMSLCMPHMTLEPILPKLSTHYWSASQDKKRETGEAQVIRQRLEKAQVPFIVELGRTVISVKEFIELQPGDVIHLTQRIGEPIVGRIGDRPKFLVQPGTYLGKIAVQILEEIRGEEEDGG